MCPPLLVYFGREQTFGSVFCLLVIVFHYPFSLTLSEFDFYLDLHFCKGSKLLIAFNH